MRYLQDVCMGTFNYIVLFRQSAGGMTVAEDRRPEHGSHLLTVFMQDMGLPEMVLMFLSELQQEYDISCEKPHGVGRAAYTGRAFHAAQRQTRSYAFIP
jgi:hypothetical protein